MSKNKKQKVIKKQKYSSRKRENSQSSFELPNFLTNDTFFLVASLVLSIIYFSFSFYSDGFYQHDGPAHYLDMRSFWYNPNGILSTWSKPGFKLIYAVPSLFGSSFVTFLNCAFAAFSAFFAYKVAQKWNPNIAFVAFILLATQHMWINLSFRNYSELISAFLLILFTFLHYDKKEFFAAFVLSYLCTIRQEAYIIAGFYFFHLLFDKKYWCIIALALFPFLQNLWGAILNNDPLYLLNSIISTGGGYQDAYPRQGFDHYLKFSPHTYGAIALTLVITFFYSLLFKWKKEFLVVLVPGLIFWLLQCIFAWQSVKIGPSNAGNLRYLLVLSPLIAVWGTLGLGNISQLTKQQKWGSLVVLLPFLIYVFFNSFL